jgi:hypothetical protein
MAFFATAYSQRLVRLHGGNFERMAKEKVEPDLKTIIRFVSPDPGYAGECLSRGSTLQPR